MSIANKIGEYLGVHYIRTRLYIQYEYYMYVDKYSLWRIKSFTNNPIYPSIHPWSMLYNGQRSCCTPRHLMITMVMVIVAINEWTEWSDEQRLNKVALVMGLIMMLDVATVCRSLINYPKIWHNKMNDHDNDSIHLLLIIHT